jgi:predicted nucleic acid-binding protein
VDLADTFLSATTFAELRRGLDKLPKGRKRRELEVWLPAEVAVEYGERIFAVDAVVADLAGKLSVEAERWIESRSDRLFAAATALVHELSVATLNRKHFERLGVALVEF